MVGWDGFLAHHSETMKRIDSVADIDTARAAGKIGFIIGLQNSDISWIPADVDFFYSLGQRVSQSADLQRAQHDRQRVHGTAR